MRGIGGKTTPSQATRGVVWRRRGARGKGACVDATLSNGEGRLRGGKEEGAMLLIGD